MNIMHQGSEFHGEWDNKKRKNSVLDSIRNSSSDKWDSGSCNELVLKQRKSQLGYQDEGAMMTFSLWEGRFFIQ